jgi:hypothetical protein
MFRPFTRGDGVEPFRVAVWQIMNRALSAG